MTFKRLNIIKKILTLTMLTASVTSLAGVNDLVVVGSDSSVILYHKDGDDIIIKICKKFTVINEENKDITSERNKCVGETLKVPLVDFRKKILDKLAKDTFKKMPNFSLEAVYGTLSAEERVRYFYNSKEKKIILPNWEELGDRNIKLVEDLAELNERLYEIDRFIRAEGLGTENYNLRQRKSLQYLHDRASEELDFINRLQRIYFFPSTERIRIMQEKKAEVEVVIESINNDLEISKQRHSEYASTKTGYIYDELTRLALADEDFRKKYLVVE